jgi:hypothetical protein
VTQAQPGGTAGSAQAAERGEQLVERMRVSLKLSDEQTAAVQEVMRASAAARAERRKAREARGEGRGEGAGEMRRDAGGEGAGEGQARSGNARGGGPGGAGGPDAGARNRFMERIEAALEPTLTAEQKPLLERWRAARQGGRMASVWVLGADRRPEQRQVRLGIADEQYAEVIGGGLKQGDRIITRQRQAAQR